MRSSDEPTMEAVNRRLARLERDVRRAKSAAGLLLIGIAAVALMGGAVQDRVEAETVVGRVVEAQALVVRDGAGKVRFLLEVDPDGPVALRISDKEGRQRLTLGVGPAGGVGLVFRDQEGNIRAGQGVGPAGRPFLIPKGLRNPEHGAHPGQPAP